MKKIFTILLLFVSINSFSQESVNAPPTTTIDKLFTQDYSKDMTEYLTKVFIARDILKLKENELTGFEIEAITASKSGELTTVLYNCPLLDQKGLVFVFWNNKQYSFYHFEYNDATLMLDRISAAIQNNKTILDEVNTSVLKSNDIHFIFDGSLIRVVWNQYDSLWDISNFKTTNHRFGKFFKKKS